VIQKIALLLCLLVMVPAAHAKRRLYTQSVETQKVENEDRVGKEAAAKYFESKTSGSSSSTAAAGDRDHYLALHIGFFIDSDAYSWGVDHNGYNMNHADDPGKLNLGLTYRMGEWTSTMDLNFRADFQTYELGKDKPLKLSVMPLITFPDAYSQFPLYFGAGLGPGIFFKQVSQESSISIDYQLIAGARMFDLIENTGFFLEFGLKNHLLLLSDGQFNGVFIAGGAMFTF